MQKRLSSLWTWVGLAALLALIVTPGGLRVGTLVPLLLVIGFLLLGLLFVRGTVGLIRRRDLSLRVGSKELGAIWSYVVPAALFLVLLLGREGAFGDFLRFSVDASRSRFSVRLDHSARRTLQEALSDDARSHVPGRLVLPEGEDAMRGAFRKTVSRFQRALSDVDVEIELDADPPGIYTPFYKRGTLDAAGVIRMAGAEGDQLLRSEISVFYKAEIKTTGICSLRSFRAAAGEMLGNVFINRLREELARRSGD